MLKQDQFERLKKWAVKTERLRQQHDEVVAALKTQIRYTIEKHNELTDEQEKEIWDAIKEVMQE